MIKENRIFVGITLAMIVAYIALQPKIGSQIRPVRMFRLSNLVNQSVMSKNIDLHSFWETREFFSPGKTELISSPTFITNNSTIELRFKSQLVNCLPIEYSRFISSHSLSETFLVSGNCVIPQLTSSPNQVLLSTEKDVIIQTKTEIIFISLRDLDQGAKVDGFLLFDLKNKDFANQHQSAKYLVMTSFALN